MIVIFEMNFTILCTDNSQQRLLWLK